MDLNHKVKDVYFDRPNKIVYFTVDNSRHNSRQFKLFVENLNVFATVDEQDIETLKDITKLVPTLNKPNNIGILEEFLFEGAYVGMNND